MWYLSRHPNLNSDDQTKANSTLITCRNSIFCASDSGIFENISIIQVAEKSIDNTPWNWFAYQATPNKFQAVVIPPNPSLKIQIISVLPNNGKFLCAVIAPSSPRPFANICMFSPHQKLCSAINYDVRNAMVAATAIIKNCLYLAGGYMGNPSYVEPLAYLSSSERLNLATGEWEMLPPMQKRRSSAEGVAFRGMFYVVGGSDDEPDSAEIYNPVSKEWKFEKLFLPAAESDGFAMGTFDHFMLLLTWSARLGIKVWIRTSLPNLQKDRGWLLYAYHPDQEERYRLKQYGARLVRVGKELWIVTGDRGGFHVHEACAWPTFPGPTFMPAEDRSVKLVSYVYAFSIGIRSLAWRKIPIYSC